MTNRTKGKCSRTSIARVLALVVSLISFPLTSDAQTRTREQNIAEIVKLSGVEALIQRSQVEWAQLAHAQIDKTRVQLNPYMNRMNPDSKLRFDGAVDKFVATVTSAYSASDAAAAWGRAFAEKFSDDELTRALEFYRTPFGDKLLKSTVASASQWNSEMRKVRSQINDSAYAQVLAELKAILEDSDRLPKTDPDR